MPLHTETYLKTQQVAVALGLSPSTVKRLVDAGHLRAARTEGKHRLILQEEVERYARERGLSVSPLNGTAAPSDGASSRRPRPVQVTGSATLVDVEELCVGLRRGRYNDVRGLIHRVYEQFGPVSLADDLVRPAMAQLGHDWQVQGIDIFQEHRATRLVKMVLFELLQEELEGFVMDSPLAIGAACEGDPYMIPGLLCELSLRWLGWDVMNLGVNLPLTSLAQAVRASATIGLAFGQSSTGTGTVCGGIHTLFQCCHGLWDGGDSRRPGTEPGPAGEARGGEHWRPDGSSCGVCQTPFAPRCRGAGSFPKGPKHLSPKDRRGTRCLRTVLTPATWMN